MSYGMTFLKFRNGQRDTIPRDTIIGVLERHGCRVPHLQEGSNEIGLPRDDEAGEGVFAELAVLSVKNGEATEFGLARQQATTKCRALLFALINELGLAMFDDNGAGLFAREDVFHDIPQDILSQYPDSERVVVNRPENCI
jgi:hypothetical protein